MNKQTNKQMREQKKERKEESEKQEKQIRLTSSFNNKETGSLS